MNIKEFSIKLADKIAEFIGSWTFIIIQSCILTVWIVINCIGLVHYDPFPFILLNLFLSFEAAYATPLILMSATRQGEKDRAHLVHDVELDQNSYIMILSLREIILELREDLKNQNILRNDHEKLKRDLEEIKELLKNGG
jgi:uncharacterized membrane protein